MLQFEFGLCSIVLAEVFVRVGAMVKVRVLCGML